MKLKIYWNNDQAYELLDNTQSVLEDLWLESMVSVELSNDETLAQKLNITKTPAFIIEEESIDYTDTIFEWMVPPYEELKSMIISIIGWGWSSCGTMGCWDCSWC